MGEDEFVNLDRQLHGEPQYGQLDFNTLTDKGKLRETAGRKAMGLRSAMLTTIARPPKEGRWELHLTRAILRSGNGLLLCRITRSLIT